MCWGCRGRPPMLKHTAMQRKPHSLSLFHTLMPTQVMQKMLHSYSGIHSKIWLWVCVHMPVMGIWCFAVYTGVRFTWVDDCYHKISEADCVSSPCPHQSALPSFLLQSFYPSNCQYWLFFILFLSMPLSTFLCLSVKPGAQLRVRSQFPHRGGLRDNRGCWQKISLGHAIPCAPLIRFPAKK